MTRELMTDVIVKVCPECRSPWTMTELELEWWIQRDDQLSLPRRCRDCRRAKRKRNTDAARSGCDGGASART